MTGLRRAGVGPSGRLINHFMRVAIKHRHGKRQCRPGRQADSPSLDESRPEEPAHSPTDAQGR
jgi:hypothetical protein